MLRFHVDPNSPAIKFFENFAKRELDKTAATAIGDTLTALARKNYEKYWAEHADPDSKWQQQFKPAMGMDGKPGHLTGASARAPQFAVVPGGVGLFLGGRWPGKATKDSAKVSGEDGEARTFRWNFGAKSAKLSLTGGWAYERESVDMSDKVYMEGRPGAKPAADVFLPEESLSDESFASGFDAIMDAYFVRMGAV